jgi:Pyruvate/2-oxoacid:ferredoxin oxidoreductase delta subunit
MGSGGLIIMDDASCMVDVARFFMEFCVDESCGKCPPCRVGTQQMMHLLDKITAGKASPEELERIEQLCDLVSTSSLCGLGMTAPNPLQSTLRHFRSEYEAHVMGHTCPAKVCTALLTYTIDLEPCTGCGMCARECADNAIVKLAGQKKFAINQDLCTHCGGCFEICKFDAVKKS